jgi:Gpi18-like mannosyltransferase
MSSGTDVNRGYLGDPYVRFILVLAAGLILRIVLSQYLTYRPDFGAWTGWGSQISSVGFGKFYDSYWCDYMPGYLYVLWALDNAHRALPWLSIDILFKLPANLADLGISILIYYSLKLITGYKNAMIASVVYFFNPASLSNSTFWGQVDSFHAFPILLSVYLGLRQKFMLSGVFAALAFMIKPQSLALFPLIGFLALKPVFGTGFKPGLRSLLPPFEMAAAALITAIIVTLPFIWDGIDSAYRLITGSAGLIIERFSASYGQYTASSLNAFNFWGAVAMWYSDDTKFVGVSYRTIGTSIFGAVYLLIMGLLIRFSVVLRNKESGDYGYYVFEAITLVLFTLYLFVTRAHERHLLPMIVFFTLITFRAWIFWYLYAIVSGVYVVNMIYSYIQLTTSYAGIPANYNKYLIPGMFFLYLGAYIVLLLSYVKDTVKYENSFDAPYPGTP